MKGYVTVDKPELKIREYELYSAYYCGVCRSVGKRYGQLPRMVLSYDAAFMALMIAALSDDPEEAVSEHCIVHPLKRKNIIINNRAVDYAADIMLILAYSKLLDDVNDDGSLPAKILSRLYKGLYHRLKEGYPELVSLSEHKLAELSALEGAKSASLDDTSACFGEILGAAFSGLSKGNDARILHNLGFQLGRWIYLTDALDDLEGDVKSGSYNPLIYRFNYNSETDLSEFRNKISEYMELLLYDTLGQLSQTFDLLTIKKNKGILNNVLFLGLRKKTDEVVQLKGNDNERSI